MEGETEGGRKEGRNSTHRVLHGRPPSLHGCEAVAEAVVPALAGVLLRLGRAQVHPHVAAQPNPPKHPPCIQPAPLLQTQTPITIAKTVALPRSPRAIFATEPNIAESKQGMRSGRRRVLTTTTTTREEAAARRGEAR